MIDNEEYNTLLHQHAVALSQQAWTFSQHATELSQFQVSVYQEISQASSRRKLLHTTDRWARMLRVLNAHTDVAYALYQVLAQVTQETALLQDLSLDAQDALQEFPQLTSDKPVSLAWLEKLKSPAIKPKIHADGVTLEANQLKIHHFSVIAGVLANIEKCYENNDGVALSVLLLETVIDSALVSVDRERLQQAIGAEDFGQSLKQLQVLARVFEQLGVLIKTALLKKPDSKHHWLAVLEMLVQQKNQFAATVLFSVFADEHIHRTVPVSDHEKLAQLFCVYYQAECTTRPMWSEEAEIDDSSMSIKALRCPNFKALLETFEGQLARIQHAQQAFHAEMEVDQAFVDRLSDDRQSTVLETQSKIKQYLACMRQKLGLQKAILYEQLDIIQQLPEAALGFHQLESHYWASINRLNAVLERIDQTTALDTIALEDFSAIYIEKTELLAKAKQLLLIQPVKDRMQVVVESLTVCQQRSVAELARNKQALGPLDSLIQAITKISVHRLNTGAAFLGGFSLPYLQSMFSTDMLADMVTASYFDLQLTSDVNHTAFHHPRCSAAMSQLCQNQLSGTWSDWQLKAVWQYHQQQQKWQQTQQSQAEDKDFFNSNTDWLTLKRQLQAFELVYTRHASSFSSLEESLFEQYWAEAKASGHSELKIIQKHAFVLEQAAEKPTSLLARIWQSIRLCFEQWGDKGGVNNPERMAKGQLKFYHALLKAMNEMLKKSEAQATPADWRDIEPVVQRVVMQDYVNQHPGSTVALAWQIAADNARHSSILIDAEVVKKITLHLYPYSDYQLLRRKNLRLSVKHALLENLGPLACEARTVQPKKNLPAINDKYQQEMKLNGVEKSLSGSLSQLSFASTESTVASTVSESVDRSHDDLPSGTSILGLESTSCDSVIGLPVESVPSPLASLKKNRKVAFALGHEPSALKHSTSSPC